MTLHLSFPDEKPVGCCDPYSVAMDEAVREIQSGCGLVLDTERLITLRRILDRFRSDTQSLPP